MSSLDGRHVAACSSYKEPDSAWFAEAVSTPISSNWGKSECPHIKMRDESKKMNMIKKQPLKYRRMPKQK